MTAFIQANPPESAQTDISLSQFLAIQEKGVSAWKFEPELEIANCFVEARTEIEFFDSICSVQSNLPVPKQNEVYYWEAKIYEKAENTDIAIGFTTKPYPLFRLPGEKHCIRYDVLVFWLTQNQASTKRPLRTYQMAIVASTNRSIPFQLTVLLTCAVMLSVLDIGHGPALFSSHAMERSSTM